MNDLYAMQEADLQSYLDCTLNASAEQRERAQSLYGRSAPAPVLYISPDGVASISIQGVLRREPASPLTRFLGITVTSYRDLVEAADRAAADDDVKSVRLLINSPGGAVDGLDEAFQHLAALGKQKPMSAEVQGVCASGAYWLACAAARIASTAPSNPVGSIGVLAVLTSLKGLKKSMGVRDFTIVSKNAPRKNADPETAAGRDTIQEHIDALERIFHSRVAAGRGVSVETVREKFGQGAMLVSMDPDTEKPDALSVGMIDKVSNEIKISNSEKGFNAMSMYRPNESQVKTAARIVAGDYPNAIKDLAGKVLAGEANPTALDIAAAAYDARQGSKPSAAAVDTEALVKAEADFMEDVNRTRAEQGLAPLPVQSGTSGFTGIASTPEQVDALVAADRKAAGIN